MGSTMSTSAVSIYAQRKDYDHDNRATTRNIYQILLKLPTTVSLTVAIRSCYKNIISSREPHLVGICWIYSLLVQTEFL